MPTPIKFSDLEQTQIDQELTEFLNKGIIEPVYTEDNEEFISNIFIRPKSDGGIRVILNLKQFNEKFMEKIHFKMESLQSTINAMSKNCYFASVDLKDAYYSVPIRACDRKYFSFFFGMAANFNSQL